MAGGCGVSSFTRSPCQRRMMEKIKIPVEINAYRVVPNATSKKVYVARVFPFGKNSPRMNKFYNAILRHLEENTNRVVVQRANDVVPANARMMSIFMPDEAGSVDVGLKTMMRDGVIGRWQYGDKEEFYMNPTCAFCGESIPEFLMKLFRITKEDLLVFDIDYYSKMRGDYCGGD